MKIIFVASDFSGLGKGTFCAALGRVLRSHGVHVRIMKSDLYFNYDAGTINPQEHGEVYVLADGTEVDQDFGIYERFTGVENSARDYITSGRVFHQIYLNEREGKYLGETVSTEHVIDEIKSRMLSFAEQADVGIVELGATIGDLKGIYALEACREIISEFGEENVAFVLLSHFPFLANVQELKTMGCQRSVSALRAKGIQPSIIVARTPAEHSVIPEYQIGKLARYCGVSREYVFCLPDLPDEYEIPNVMVEGSLHQIVALKLGLILRRSTLPDWYEKFDPPTRLRVALVGKYSHGDAYVSIHHQLRLFGVEAVEYLPNATGLDAFDGVIIPGGWGKRGTDEVIAAAEKCRREGIPTLGICLGLQLMVIEYAQNVMGLGGANSAEFEGNAEHSVIVMQEEQKRALGLGGTSRLGNWTTLLEEDSIAAKAYDAHKVVQRHRHRFEVSADYDFGRFRVTGRDERTGLIEVMELSDHPFYLGVQFHPEFGPQKNPIIGALVHAAKRNQRSHAQAIEIAPTFPTPPYLPDSVVPASPDEIRRIAGLPVGRLNEVGITAAQQEIFVALAKRLDEHEAVMDREEQAIRSLELQMREINQQPERLAGGSLSESDIQRMRELQSRSDDRRSRISELRMAFEDDFSRIEAGLSKFAQAG
jgi:CTP synthase